MLLMMVVAAGLMAQSSPDDSGLSPYILHFNSDPEPLRVLADPADVGKISFEVLVDEPWTRAPRWETIQRITLKPDGVEPEESALREAWLNAEWPRHGGVQVTVRSGQRRWVLKDEQAWAEKAQNMARTAYAVPAEPAPDPELPAESSSAGPGAAALWAPHAAVIAGSVALAAAVYLLLLRKPEQWQPIDSGNPAPRRR